MSGISRRAFLRGALAGSVGFSSFGAGFWAAAFAQPARPGPGPYPSIDGRSPDASGLVLPEGFTARVIGETGKPVGGTGYDWHPQPDGGCVFPVDDGGWIYVSNSEAPGRRGGVSAIRFDADGEIVDAYRILEGTERNCSGGPTPWGTWLSCEEFDAIAAGGSAGSVWECDPLGERRAVELPAMGRFSHEAAAVDPEGKAIYLTEDQPDGLLYRFTPDAWPDLRSGRLEAASGGAPGRVSWLPIDTTGERELRRQNSMATTFAAAEGAWFDSGVVYFVTKGDNAVWQLDIEDQQLDYVYDPRVAGESPLGGVDNITASPAGDLFIAEDGGNLELIVISTDREVAPFARLEGHGGSEIAGPAFTPDGSRLYLSSLRGTSGKDGDRGITWEITGPFRTSSADLGPPTSGFGLVARDETGGDAGPPLAPIVGGGALLAGAAGAAVALRRRTADRA